MKIDYYKEKSATAEGRYDLHAELLADIRRKMDELVNNAPDANKAKVAALFENAYNNLESEGNSILFYFFANEEISTKEFVRNIQNSLNKYN